MQQHALSCSFHRSCREQYQSKIVTSPVSGTEGTFPLQEFHGSFMGPKPLVRVSTAGTFPEEPFTETFTGPNRVPSPAWVLRSALKSPGWSLRFTLLLVAKPRAGCDVEHRRRGALVLQTMFHWLIASTFIYDGTHLKLGNIVL